MVLVCQKQGKFYWGGRGGGEKEKRGSERELEMGEALIKVERVVSL